VSLRALTAAAAAALKGKYKWFARFVDELAGLAKEAAGGVL
jgi:hypothetical protein